MRPNEKGGTGALWYIDKTFTIASTQDQFIATMHPIISPTITTCKGSRGGCSDEAIEEIKAVHAARQQQPFITKPEPMTTQPNTPQVPMRFLSVCSGMEAASVAWEPLGWKAVGFSEIEPFPCAILKHRFPNTPNYGSLTEYQSWPLEPGSIDLLVGGTPCQSFSVAGLRKGLADPRGNLALVFLGLADKLKPRWIVWENVPGVLSSNGGRDFGSFLGALVQLGYGFAFRVLDAQHFGVPQRRRRVFVVACLGDWRAAAEVLLESDCVRRDIKKGRAKGQATAPDAGASVETGGLQTTVGTLCADTHPRAYSGQDAYTGRLIPTVLDRAAFNQGQNAQYEPLIEQTETCPTIVSKGPHAVQMPFRKSKRATSTTDNETWVEGDVSNTLNNFDLGDTRTTHAVVQPNVYENHPNDSRITGPLDVAPTVVSRFGTGGGNVPLVNNEPVTFQPGNLRRDAGADPSTTTTTTLKASSGDQTPCVAYCAEVSGTLTVGHGSSAGHQHRMGDNSFLIAPVIPMAVRRLTPVECERLQGFPDNWSRIPWKGKPEDQCPDGPRYRACGNSMAVPVMLWIGEQIARVEAEGK